MEDDQFTIHARFLKHGVENIGWRVTEKNTRKFDPQKLSALGVTGPNVRLLERNGTLEIAGKTVHIDDVSSIRIGDSLAVVIDTLPCQAAIDLAHNATLLLCESTYIEEHRDLATKHSHLTALQAAHIAKTAGAKQLVLTHFSARYRDSSVFEKEAQEVFPRSYAAADFKVFAF